MFKDPYESNLKPELGVGEWLVMLFFFLMAVIVGFFCFLHYVIEPTINPPPQASPKESK